MNKFRRRQTIEARIGDHSEVVVAELAREFGVSEMTIRRDLKELDQDGVLVRVRGGAVRHASRSFEPPRSDRATSEPSAKRAIGRAAAALLEQGDSAILDVGTTTGELARALRGREGLTIVTASLPVAVELGEERGIRVLLTGGTLRPGELSLVGARAEEAFQDLNCDIAFIGVAGLTSEEGLTEYSLDDTRVKQAAMRHARRVAVLADHSKLGRVALATICPLNGVDLLITDAARSHPVCLAARDAGVEVICALDDP
jgi:DeoR/GlpR family transcriptional regulator of sugar metabolism